MKRNPEITIPFLYFAAFIGVQIIAVILILGFGFDPYDNMNDLIRLNSITNLAFYGTLFALFSVLFIPLWKGWFKHLKDNVGKVLTVASVGLFSMFVASFAIGSLYLLLDITTTPENQEILENQLNGPLFDKVVLVIFAILLTPLVEELMFRFAGFKLLEKIKWMSRPVIILTTSFLFGLLHVMGDNMIQIVYYLGLGIVLGTIYEKSENILAPILVHMLFNAIVTMSMFGLF